MKRFALISLAVLALACTPPPAGAKDPARETARSVVLTVADAIHAADATCAAVATARRDANLAQTCADAYDLARASAITAAEAIDAWDAGRSRDVACALAHAAAGLATIVDAVAAAGGKLPAVVEDAAKLAPIVAGMCR